MAVALAVVLVTSRRQSSVGSSVRGAAIGTRCDDWLRPPDFIMQKIVLGKSAPLRCSREHFFLPPGALFGSRERFFGPEEVDYVPRMKLYVCPY